MGLLKFRSLITFTILAVILLPKVRADVCHEREFGCDDGSCIPLADRCNRIEDCPSGEDEIDCLMDECEDGFQCSDGRCLDAERHCNGVADCPEGEDEEDCDEDQDNQCAVNEILCDGNKCLPASYKCDTTRDCEDGTDEADCPAQGTEETDDDRKGEPRQCSSHEWQCRNAECVNSEFVCDGTVDCVDQSDEDETFCNLYHGRTDNENEVDDNLLDTQTDHCQDDEFFCGGRCIESEKVCDGVQDCVDYSDEYNCPPEEQTSTRPSCPEDECHDGTCISRSQICDGRRDCSEGEDENDCPCRDDEFQCRDGSCIPADQRCNRRYDCTDGSDEQDCPSAREQQRCRPGEFQCNTGECISESRKCDRHVDCRDGSDENDCPARSPPRPDYGVGLNLKTYPNEQIIKERIIKEGREVVFQCRDEGPIRARVHWVRRNGRPLPPGTRDLNGRLEIPNILVDQGGEYICEAVGYPKSTPGSSVSVHLTVEKYNRTDYVMPLACGPHQATCMSGDCIPKSKICDGVFDCTDGSDENSCSSGRCEPNEFKCRNRKCVLKTWRCDGENDCGDNSDEDGCGASQPGVDGCRYDEFKCASGQCIPKSFQCDSQSDCSDNTDEIGCIAPAVITPPPPMVRLQAGVVFNITCRATGNPVPLVVWRLNWGHIPEKCSSTSYDGFGTLTCPDIQPIDSGAYSCEIINSMGTHFVSPDTILVVSGSPMEDICPVGLFNKNAIRREECISCFCFGVSTQCKSADLFSYVLNPPVTSQTVVGVDGPWNGLSDISVGEYDSHRLTSTRHGVNFRASDIPAASNRVYPYLSLPSEYTGNQLKSYGGFLRYEVEFSGRGGSNDIPDVIIQGNGYTLTYRVPNRLYPNSRNNITVGLSANNLYKIDGSYASREEVMMVLANVDTILVKLQYIDDGERDVELLHVTMDSAALRDMGLGSASLVEECRCPAGYVGLSCETCDVGYVRQKTGPWLGRCVREEEPCRPGTYGDPNRGISCKPCPCPVPGQSRARTCSMDRYGNVICNCDRGYSGPRCEECAPDYMGDPLSSQGCIPRPISDCNPDGTERILSNGRCECKFGVSGSRCDQCSPESFYLGPRGCNNCFCMGVTNQCTSSNLYRDSVRSSFTSPTSDFALVSGYDEPTHIADRLRVENREVAYRNFAISDETYYWSLPPSFLGNKLTSYGGNLTYTVRYTPQPSGGASRSNSPDIVIVSGNEITLHHYRQDSLPPSGSQTFQVPIYEDYWQHYSDGTSANREHLLMALANVTAIYIKATYTTVAEEAGLSQVELDISSEQNYGSNQRAWEVEQCSCPLGHQGLSCEDCSPGYYKGDQGLYLGLCEPCYCNGHSDECDSKTGICRNCRDNTYGDNCELCLPGFFGNATSGGCIPSEGSVRCDDCNVEGTSSCDIRRGSCNCKPNVVGSRCDECRPGTFGLSETNDYGCRECFCSGTTSSCSAGVYFRDEIPLFIIDEQNRFSLTDRDGGNALPEDFERNIDENSIVYQFNDDSSVYYWNLPERLTGNLVLSYGGHLQITQHTDGSGRYTDDQDIIIKGNGITLYYTRPNYEQVTYRVPFEESSWQTQNQYGPRPASRSDLLTALSNVESILIRASLRSYTAESKISDIILETAVRQRTSYGRVNDIEVCRCPPGYRGTSCEQCDNLYYRDVYDRTAGLLGTCKQCPCENAESCETGPSRRVQCRCLPGWSGEYCRDRAGTQPTPPPPPSVRPPTIRVVINTPQIKIVEIGETTEFNCNGYYVVNNAPVTIRWYKYEGALSERAYVDEGTLYIQDAQVDDSGVYICQAQIGSEIVRDNVTLTVGDSAGGSRAPEVTVSPAIISQEENSVAELRCSASGYPEPRIQWYRLDGQPLSSDVIVRGGYLRFNSLRRSDEGTYRCYAQNNVGDSDQTVQVYIRRSQPEVEEVFVSPDRYVGEPGVDVVLRCSSSPPGRVTWTKTGAVELPRNVFVSGEELTIRYSTADDSGRYICNIQFPSGNQRSSTAEVSIVARSNEQSPRITPLERSYTVVQGSDFELSCESTGNPYPTISWSMNGGQFESNARQTGDMLRILNARPENSGVYICLASNNAGSDQVATIIEIERREPPVIELFPKEPQSLKIGESARLSCRVTSGTPYPTVTWSRRDGRLLSTRFSEDYPGVITLREATVEDSGIYECKAINEAGATTLTATIQVQQVPVIVLTPDQQSFDLTEGDELRFSCSAVGIPDPTVQITVPDNSNIRVVTPFFTPGVGRPEASISHKNIQRSQAGLYECIAVNDAGQDTRYIQVNVKPKRGDVGVEGDDGEDNEIDYRNRRPDDRQRPDDRERPDDRQRPDDRERPDDRQRPDYRPDPRPNYPPSEPEGTVIDYPRGGEQSSFTVHLGERAEFNCKAEDNSMTTEWRRADGRQLPYGSRNYGGQLVIENVRNDAAGIYECYAYDHVRRRPVTLLVAQLIVIAGPPKITFSPPMPIIVKAGEDVLIYCNATGEGSLRVQWHAEGGYDLPSSIDVSGNYLRFNRIAPADEGRYVCTASSIYGNTTKVAEVIVNNINSPPPEELPSYGRTKEAYEGDTVSLTCSDDNPGGRFSRFEWEREYEKLPPLAENRDNTLILYNTRYEDGGRYICKTFTEDGRMTQNYVDLVIKPPIPFLKLNPSRSFAKPGDTVEVDCTSSVGPHVKVTWEKPGSQPFPFNFKQYGNRLIVDNVQKEDSGKYSCVCYTDEGQVYMSEFELNVEDKPAEHVTPKVEHAEVGATVVLRCNSRKPSTTYSWSRQHGTFPPDMDTSSEILKLINVQASDAGTYICTARHNGQSVEIPTTLVVTGAIPFFPQSPRSYMKFPKFDQAYSKFNFEITFRPERPNGLILYNGQRRGGGDFISLSLEDGIPQFRYSFGDQQGILAPEKALTLGEWHTVKVNRVRTNGWMIVDDQHPVTFPPNQKFQGLNLEEELFIGGVPKYEHIAPTASEVKEGFVGCISRLMLNERDIQLNQEALYVEGTTSCEPCADEPCMNEGVCLETQTEHGYTCVCQDGYTGKNCQVEGFQCSLGVCGIGRCGETETGIECYCPLNRTGDRCQYIEHYDDGILSFRDGSYAAYNKLTGKKNIKFKIRPESDEDGVILYAAESEKAFGDFIAVIIKDKHVEFRYVVGGKVIPVIIRSKDPVKVDEWMDISVGRSRAGLGYLQVDNEPQVNEVKAGGRAQTLFLKTNLYVGGYDRRNVLNRGVGVTRGFQGCVAGLEVAGKGIDMIADMIDSANVENCGHQIVGGDDESSGDAEISTNAPMPICRPGYAGRNCDIISDYCLANDPCENGGICTTMAGNKYHCDCTLGYTGENCQHMVALRTKARFKGNGYLELNRNTIANNSTQLASGLAVLFSTKEPNGLILWYGQEKGKAFNGGDFLALGVSDGILEFYFRIDGEESFIRQHSVQLTPNRRHIAIIKRTKNQASLELDGLTEYGETQRPTSRDEMFLPGHVFLGGAPDLKRFTGERYSNGFIGCIHAVEPLTGGAIQLGENTVSSLNVDECSPIGVDEEDDDDDDFFGTEPPLA